MAVRVVLGAALAACSIACGSVAAYLRGPAPPAALADPEVRVVVRERTDEGAWSAAWVAFESSGSRVRGGEAFEITGRVSRVARGFAPRWGFRIAIETPTREAVLDVALFREMPKPDLEMGETVTLRARSTGDGLVVEVRDEASSLFVLSAGAMGLSPMAEGGVEVSATSGEAYREVRSGEDLCLRTYAHRPVRVRVGGESQRIGPGESRVLCGEDGVCWLVVLADAQETEEPQCAGPEPARLVVFWMRVAAGTVAGR